MAVLGAVGILTAVAWTASTLTSDAQAYRLRIRSELQEIAYETAASLDGDRLAQGSLPDLGSSRERLEQLGGIARVERAAIDEQSAKVLNDVEESTPDVVSGTAIVRDSFGEIAGTVRIAAPSRRPLLQRLGRIGMLGIFASGLLALLLKGANLALRSHCRSLVALADRRPEDAVGRAASREICQLAISVNQLLGNAADSVEGDTDDGRPEIESESKQKKEELPPDTFRGDEAIPFQPGPLLHEIVDRIRPRAAKRRVELSIVVGEQVPERAIGRPLEAGKVMTALLENALQTTGSGCVLARVSRDPSGQRLRFEVRDTGAGLSARQQDELRRELAHASRRPPAELEHPIHGAAATIAALGGTLDFDAHRGGGSRFWFTLPFEAVAVVPSAVTQQPEELSV